MTQRNKKKKRKKERVMTSKKKNQKYKPPHSKMFQIKLAINSNTKKGLEIPRNLRDNRKRLVFIFFFEVYLVAKRWRAKVAIFSGCKITSDL